MDVIWQLKATDMGLQFKRMATRVAWVGEYVDLKRNDDPLSYQRINQSWPTGTFDKVRELDELDAPTGLSRRKMSAWMKERGASPGPTIVLNAAVAYRNNRIMGL